MAPHSFSLVGIGYHCCRSMMRLAIDGLLLSIEAAVVDVCLLLSVAVAGRCCWSQLLLSVAVAGRCCWSLALLGRRCWTTSSLVRFAGAGRHRVLAEPSWRSLPCCEAIGVWTSSLLGRRSWTTSSLVRFAGAGRHRVLPEPSWRSLPCCEAIARAESISVERISSG
jgi:hypothetical protein